MAQNVPNISEEPDESELKLIWFHCNECHRSFQNHNRIQRVNSSLRLIKTDLVFAFSSCGHTFCINCINSNIANEEGKFICPRCRMSAKYYKIEGSVIPKKIEMYLKPPIDPIEDGLTVMMVI